MVSIRPGDIRFMVGFEDQTLSVPIIRTLKFDGLRTTDGGERVFAFFEVKFASAPEVVVFLEANFEELLLDSERLIETLRRAFDGTLPRRGLP